MQGDSAVNLLFVAEFPRYVVCCADTDNIASTLTVEFIRRKTRVISDNLLKSELLKMKQYEKRVFQHFFGLRDPECNAALKL